MSLLILAFLNACNAADSLPPNPDIIPNQEMCNGIDDDSDGLVDEEGCPEPACPAVDVTAPPEELKLSPFYTQYVDAGGIPIISRNGVPNDAFRVAYYVLAEMLAERPCLRRSMIENGIRIGLFGPSDVTTDFPEYSDLYDAFPDTDWDQRGRGFGASIVRPLTSVGFENLLRLDTDLWRGESILVHEFAHTFFEFGVREQHNGLEQQTRLEELYEDALDKQLWINTYAATNSAEYWAETVQTYFNTNLESDPPNGIHGPINTRAELLEYDPMMARFIGELFAQRPWKPYCMLDGRGPTWSDPTPENNEQAECMPRVRRLARQECSVQLQSEQADVEVEMEFVNRRFDEGYTLQWVNYQGEFETFGQLPPRGIHWQSTFQSHPWRVIDGQGNCVGVYVATDQSGRIIIE